MHNELILIVTLILEFSGVVLSYVLFRKAGLYFWTILATIAANIEVLILVRAFGMNMTLGNILFASTFLVTDILSELYGKHAANTAVKLGIATTVCFVAISSSWLLYRPAADDTMMPPIRAVFSHTPRVMLASLGISRRKKQGIRSGSSGFETTDPLSSPSCSTPCSTHGSPSQASTTRKRSSRSPSRATSSLS